MLLKCSSSAADCLFLTWVCLHAEQCGAAGSEAGNFAGLSYRKPPRTGHAPASGGAEVYPSLLHGL